MKTATQGARKGTIARVPLASPQLLSRSAGHQQENDLLATVKHYLVHQTCVIKKRPVQQKTALRLFVLVDSSASMAADRQISLVKGLITDMLHRYRQQRPQVSIIALAQGTASVIIPFTTHLSQTNEALASLRTGGKTNLAAGFRQMAQMIRPNGDYQLYLFTDGRINAGTTSQPFEEAVTVFREQLRRHCKHTCIINTETGYPRLNMAVTLAEKLGCKVFGPEIYSA
ncbi:VWA domain-containing protein [Chitinophaga sp. HK235]|uniref:vWA domain-containing protein n=1 Tax=Chitinophaga sp. HK235 TaxID=2952571 RepID=UPI001BAE1F8D|nr:VWA domain-containing protein [Chitinophaga sp. HK235]